MEEPKDSLDHTQVVCNKTNQHTTPAYPPGFTPSPTFIAPCKQRQTKEYFYHKGSDLFGFIKYKDKKAAEHSIKTGCGIYLLNELPNNLHHINYSNCYIFTGKKPNLFFIRNGQAEEVTINNMNIFMSKLFRMMENKNYKYILKHIDNNQIYALITANGGHIPSPWQFKPLLKPYASPIIAPLFFTHNKISSSTHMPVDTSDVEMAASIFGRSCNIAKKSF